jgi:hypothetical protein
MIPMKQSLVLALAAMAMASSAMAGTREDVLAGTARCGAISDDRVWLDCYYGAAQPMRNRFGLTPAPEFQTKLVPGATAQPSVSGLVPPPRTAATAPPMPQQNKSGDGVLGALFGGKVLIDRMRLAAYSFDKSGILTVTLSDGEVWQQMKGDDRFAHWAGPASRYVATIKEGSLGSANLQVQGENAQYKVRRVR